MKSRRNGLKHGLTGAGIVIPDEDVQAVADRFEAFEGDLKPRNEVAKFMTQRAALLSVRLERAARQEAAMITRDMLKADGAEADARAAELARLIDLIKVQPEIAVRTLQRSSEGIDWLINSWRGLKGGLFDRTTRCWDHQRAQRLSSGTPSTNGNSRLDVLSFALYGQFELLSDGEWADLTDLERREAARSELDAMIDAEIAKLEVVRQGLDHEAIAHDRAGAKARVIFNPSNEAELARKYEARAERGFYKALKEIERINEAVEESDEVDANTETTDNCDELASCFPARGSGSNRIAALQELNRQDTQEPQRIIRREKRECGKTPIFSAAPLKASP